MKKNYLLILIVVFIACTSRKTEIKIDPINSNHSPFTLNDIADDIKYIPLDNSFPIGSFYSIKISAQNIYMSIKDIGIIKFNRDGTNPKLIGSRGRGPGEYYYFMNFDIDPKMGSIYVLDKNVIKVYSGSGQFKRSISLKEYDEYFENIHFFNEKLLVSDYITMGVAKYSWLILDTTGALLKKKYNPIPTFKCNLGSGGGAYFYNDKIFYWDWYNDTIFSISSNLSIKEIVLFNTGEFRFPKTVIKDYTKTDQFMWPNVLLETNKFFLFSYCLKHKYFIKLYFKNNNNTFITLAEQDLSNGQPIGGIRNDIDGGPTLWPTNYFTDKGREYLIGIAFPFQILKNVTSVEFKSISTNYPFKKKELEKLANSLKETDNPVLMIVRLKK